MCVTVGCGSLAQGQTADWRTRGRESATHLATLPPALTCDDGERVASSKQLATLLATAKVPSELGLLGQSGKFGPILIDKVGQKRNTPPSLMASSDTRTYVTMAKTPQTCHPSQ